MRPRAALLLLALVPLAATPAGALELSVEVDSRVGEPRISNSQSTDRLRARLLDNRPGLRWRSDHDRTGGLTEAQVQHSITMEMRMRRTRGDGRVCLEGLDLDGEVAVDPVTVHIARRYAPGSCPYRVVRAHEMEHVAIWRRFADRVTPVVRSGLRAAAGELNGYCARSSGALQRQVKARLSDAMGVAVRSVYRRARAEHAEIDSDGSYAALSGRCEDW